MDDVLSIRFLTTKAFFLAFSEQISMLVSSIHLVSCAMFFEHFLMSVFALSFIY